MCLIYVPILKEIDSQEGWSFGSSKLIFKSGIWKMLENWGQFLEMYISYKFLQIWYVNHVYEEHICKFDENQFNSYKEYDG